MSETDTNAPKEAAADAGQVSKARRVAWAAFFEARDAGGTEFDSLAAALDAYELEAQR